jgi:hypothetical protein
MSASDAAPLPRLGEVFFDVRGSSRSMRLSWYADTGVAVFSIWQGGMCTGTFRLPISDLPRMIEILQRGPRGGARSGHGAEQDWAGPEAAYSGQRDYPTGGVLGPDGRYPEQPRAGYGRDDLAETAAASYGADDLGDAPGYGRDDLTDTRRGRYGRDDLSDTRRGGYGRDDLPDARGGYGREDPADVRMPGYRHDASAELSAASFGRDTFSDGPYPGYQAEPQVGASGERQGWDDGTEAPPGYGQERFVPPYVRGTAGEYVNDIPAPEAEMPTAGRRIAYRSDVETGRSGVEDYQDPSWARDGYSDEPRYRLPGEQAGPSGDWTGHSAGRHTGSELNQREPGGYTTGHGPADDIHGEARDYRARRVR